MRMDEMLKVQGIHDELVDKIKRLEAALRQYANKKLWTEDGRFMAGKGDEAAEIARAALADAPEQSPLQNREG